MKQRYCFDLRCMCTPVQRLVDSVNKRHCIRKLPLPSHSRESYQNRICLPLHWCIGEGHQRHILNIKLKFSFIENWLNKKAYKLYNFKVCILLCYIAIIVTAIGLCVYHNTI